MKVDSGVITIPTRKVTDKERSIAYTVTKDGCWVPAEKMATITDYPVIHWKGRVVLLCRFVYTLMGGTIEDGLRLYRTCENKMCFNPAHMEKK